MWEWAIVGVLLVIAFLVTGAFAAYRRSASRAQTAFAAVAARARPPAGSFDPAAIAGLPEVAQRYFTHAILPGTPLRTTVELEMEGTFLIGDKARFTTYEMTARQVLAPPAAFVWVPAMRSGLIHISGSDALVDGRAWTRFWINGLVPVVNLHASPDLNRSAAARSAMEAIWAPASLLPGNGVHWEANGPDRARLGFEIGIEPIDLTLDANGRVLSLATLRWSDANRDKNFRLQPFGGTLQAEATFEGFTIPSAIQMGNHYGTEDYLPFFQARITSARFR
jgi:hypothetical protein